MRFALLTIACFLLWPCRGLSQTCVPDYFFSSISGAYPQKTTKITRNRHGDLLTLGTVSYRAGDMYFFDGWIACFTPQGTPLWSKRFHALDHNTLGLQNIIEAADSSYYIIGTEGHLYTVVSPYESTTYGLLLHVDKKGRLLFAGKLSIGFDRDSVPTFLNDIQPLPDGSLLLTATIGSAPASPRPYQTELLVTKLDQHLHTIWVTRVSSAASYQFSYSLRKACMLGDGNILVAGITDQQIGPQFPRVGYFLLNLDQTSGKPNWNHLYSFIRDSLNTYWGTSASLQNLQQLPNGDFSFQAFSVTPRSPAPPNSNIPITFLTDASGKLKKATSYTDPAGEAFIVDAQSGGDQTLALLDDGGSSPIVTLSEDGTFVQSQHGYTTGPTLLPTGFTLAQNGAYVLLNDRGPYGGATFLMKVDAMHNIVCKNGAAALTTSDETGRFREEDAGFESNMDQDNVPLFAQALIVSFDYPLETTESCKKSCCKDVRDTASEIVLCKGKTYKLPDGYEVSDSGWYHVQTKTALGCDSIEYYHFRLERSPEGLSITGDACLRGKDSVKLSATAGFEAYHWDNTPNLDSAIWVKTKGAYKVSVSNACGTGTATFRVYDPCDAALLMPSAFTPNGDGLNDYLRVPPGSLIRQGKLIVYDRWGRRVFESSNVFEGWDGKYKGLNVPPGNYIYEFQYDDYENKKHLLKGSVLLLR